MVWVTAPSEVVAASLARSAVEARLAACGNIIAGVRSVYRWEDSVHEDPEVMIVFKTTAARLDALRDHVVAAHPYDCPEVIATPVVAGHAAYLQWVQESTEGDR